MDREKFLNKFRAHIEEVFSGNEIYNNSNVAIGCSIPGDIDPETGELASYTLMPFLKGVNFRDIITEMYPGKQVVVEHNIESMASYFIHDSTIIEKYRRILFISARSATASGLVFDGNIISGDGEFGHIKVSDTDKRCVCGRRGCLDCFFSLKSFLEIIPGSNGDGGAFLKDSDGSKELALLSEKYMQGDSGVTQELDRRLGYFASAMLDVINVTAPDLVILSGKLLKAYGDPIKRIGELLEDQFPDSGYVSHYSNAEILFKDLGAEISAQGICYRIIRDEWGYYRED